MRLQGSLVLSLLVGAVRAASDTAKVYIFQNPEFLTSSITPTLTPEEARLVIAQRLGSSQLHSLNDVSENALAHINAFGGAQKQLFTNDGQEERSQLLIVIDDAIPEAAARYQKDWAPATPAFEILTPPSGTVNEQLISNVMEEETNPQCRITRNNVPSNKSCWPRKSKIMQFHALSSESSSSPIQKIREILSYVETEAMDVMVILMPESRHRYDLYDISSRSHVARSAQLEEPIAESNTSLPHGSDIFSPAKEKKGYTTMPVWSTCYQTNDTCQNATGNCSGHGYCKRKYKSDVPGDSCYTCGCIASINITLSKDGKDEIASRKYWGGAACQKEDISSPFWLLLGITVVLIGTVSAGIGMLISIGEEKLPSVIGAGVSGPKGK